MHSSQSITSLSKILNFVLKGENNFCCLCFNIDHSISLHDELSIEINETGQNISVTDILQSVFGNEIEDYLSMFENICENCLKSMINMYTFMETCQYNMKLLTKSLVRLNDSCVSIKDENMNCKSLFVTLNLEDFTSNHVYDSKNFDSKSAALKRLEMLKTPKSSKVVKKEESPQRKSKKKHSADIKTSDMLLDPSDKLLRKCKVCYKVFSKIRKLRVHFLNNHMPNEYKCPQYPKAYSSCDLLNYHINEFHTEIVCSECGKTFTNKDTLKRHKMVQHMKLICFVCGRSYKSRFTYKKHMELNVCKQECRASPANAQYTCDHCGKKYTQKMSLRVHIQYDHGNYQAHVCEWCGKKFWAQSRLKAHIVKHTREKNFTCSICQGKFVTKESLLYHTRLHTGEKPYKCHECGSTFISASRRAYHMKTYHLLAIVKCDICSAKFTSRLYLDKHKKCHNNLNDSENKNGKEMDPKNSEKFVMNPPTKLVMKDNAKTNDKSLIKKIVEGNKMTKYEINYCIKTKDNSSNSCDDAVVFLVDN